jgi:CheY-like chemotaxis protein
MRKKILVADKSDAIRNIAESLLHQNGFDVVTAATVEKAKQLIISSDPNMVVIGADLKDAKEIYLYEILAENEATSKLPMLLIADPDGRDIPFPPEVVLPRPFEPNELVEKVNLFVGGNEPSGNESNPEDPFNAASVDDEFLDAALGLDHLQVENSEEMDKTSTIERSRRARRAEDDDDFGIAHKDSEENADDSTRVESLMIREDGFAETREEKQKAPDDLSSSSKIELPNDPYGLADDPASKEKGKKAPAGETGEHDYDWFINEMQKDTSDIKFAPDKSKDTDNQDDKLQKDEEAYGLEQVKPENKSKVQDKDAEIKTGGVDEFISEFKKEMEHLNKMEKAGQGRTPDSRPADKSPEKNITREKDKTGKVDIAQKQQAAAWDEKHSLAPDELQKLSNKLVESVAEKLAASLVEKLDKDEIYRIIQMTLPDILAKSGK